MALDVERPDPPDVTNRQVPGVLDDVDVRLGDLRRGEIETALRDGAWRDGFEEWETYTDVDEASIKMAIERELFAEFDFYYDPAGEQVRAVSPSPPEDWASEVGSGSATELRTALDDLGETVADVLVRDYLDWGEATEGDYIWREESFSTAKPDEME